jgi:hypothetical protein
MSARKSKKSLRKPASKPGRKRPARRGGSSRSARPAKKRSASHRPAKRSGARPASRPTRKSKLDRARQRGRDKQKLLAQREKERAQKQKQRQQLDRQREKERAARAREKERFEKERDRERKQKQKQKEKEQLDRQREKERLAKEREKERRQKEREKEQLAKEREKDRVRKEKDKLRAEQEKKKQKALALKLRQEERERKRKAAAEERARKIAERDALREQIRKQKEEERARREAEREAYRKAKEAERERLRAEREAARRALEGKVARASKRLARQDGLLGRGITTTRVYRPDAIPDQSGTTRRTSEVGFRPLGVRPISVSSHSDESALHAPSGDSSTSATEVPRPTPPPPAQLSVEERYQLITERLGRSDSAFQREYRENFDMSWIYHDSALEGVVYTFQELKAAIDPTVAVVPDSSLQPACEEIRRHRLAIELVRDLAERKRVPINVDMVKKLYVTLHPEEGDVKTVKYRKDIPQHRLYFHEYVPPDKIAYRVRQIVDWLNGPEPKKMKNPLRVAARVHYDLVRVFPFQTDSGKVSRLLMNLILMRSGYPPAIIHSTERQRYYEALKGQLPIILQMVADAISNALLSIEKLLDDYESRPRGGAAPAAAPTSG